MFIIENAVNGTTYEVEFPKIAGYTTPVIDQIYFDGNNKSIDVNYVEVNRPVELLDGLANLTVSVRCSTDQGMSYKPTSDQSLLSSIKFIEYDYTTNDYKIASLIQDSSKVVLKKCKKPFGISDFNDFFLNIAAGYYYILKIENIDNYKFDSVFYKKVTSDNKTYELEINLIKTDIEVTDNICFEIPVDNNVTEVDDDFEFSLKLTSGYSKESITWSEIYPTTINFNTGITKINNKNVFLSGIYKIIDIFGNNSISWIKPQSTSITYSNTSVTILNTSRNCLINTEVRELSGIKTLIVKNLERIVNS